MDIFNLPRYALCIALIIFSSLCHSITRVGVGVVPFPDEAGDTVIILDDLIDTDKSTNRTGNEYDLTFNFEISKYIGDKDKLISNGLMDKNVTIILASFDVDNEPTENAQFGYDCDNDGINELVYYEVNEVFLNGVKIGELKSGNNTWSSAKNIIEADINLLNFPLNQGLSASNSVQIKVDVKNTDVELSSGGKGCNFWETEIDFVSLHYEVIDPFVIIPGLGGDPTNLQASLFKENLMNKYGIPSEIISYDYPDYYPSPSAGNLCETTSLSYRTTVGSIKAQILTLAEQWQTDSINLVGHSKGGLESIFLIKNLQMYNDKVNVVHFNTVKIPAELKINSFATLGTPYKGTEVANRLTPTLLKFSEETLLAGKYIPSFCDLTTTKATGFSNKFSFGDSVKYFQIGANADINNNGYLNLNEQTGVQGSFGIVTNLLHLSIWRTTGHWSPVWNFVNGKLDLGNITYFDVIPNDIYVQVDSAIHTSIANKGLASVVSKNHGTIIDEQVQNYIVEQYLKNEFLWREQK